MGNGVGDCMGTNIMHRSGRALMLFTALLVASAQTAVVAVASESDPWEYYAGLYLWGPSIKGESAQGDDFEITFSDLLDDLEMVFMGQAGMRKEKWGLDADLIYMNLKQDSKKTVRIPIGPGIAGGFKNEIKLKAWVFTPTAHYTLVDTERNEFNLLAGLRYLYLDAEVKLKFDGPLPPDRKRDLSDSGSNWDGIIGFRGRYNFDEKWYLPYYADVGTGQSKNTWQVFGGVGYQFAKIDAVLGYRYLKWEFDDNNALNNLKIMGPMLGFNYRF